VDFCENDETGRTEWPLSLAVPPPASHYQAALRKKAARIYNVPEREIVLGEITVDFYNELNGTVRGWQAKQLLEEGVYPNSLSVDTWWFRKYAPHDKELVWLEVEAREAKRGLWADRNPIPPWEWRKLSKRLR
jgi:endonuclease YncB( thermonuclease family)